MHPAPLRLVLWSTGLAAASAVLAGADVPSAPLASAGELARWSRDAPPADVAVALLRLGGLLACGHLLAATALAVAAQALRRQVLARAVDRFSPAVVRRMVAGGSGLAVATLATTVPAGATPWRSAMAAGSPDDGPVATVPLAPSDAATMTRTAGGVPAGPGGTPGSVAPSVPPTATMTRAADPARPPTPDGDGGGRATMARLPEPARPAEPATADGHLPRHPRPAGPAATDEARPVPPGRPRRLPPLPAADPATWRVSIGDSLWSIADEVVHQAHPAATEGEVAAYWRVVVAANRPHLVDPDDPDLLLPGQELAVPPLG